MPYFLQSPPAPQVWQSIKEHSAALWTIGKNETQAAFKRATAQYGVRDWIARQLLENLHGPDEAKWKPEVAYLEEHAKERLANPFL